MKKLLIAIIIACFYSEVFSQNTNEKIYFLADTINVSKENRFLKHGYVDNAFEYFFVFYCKCAYPYKDYVTFSYVNKKGEKKTNIVSKKPNYPYISFKKLMDIAGKYHRYFDDSYDLYITEALPNNKFRTNKVKFVGYSQPIDDSVLIKND